jgi:hypothetical protein
MGSIKDEHMILTCHEKAPLTRMRGRILTRIAKEFEGDPPDYSNYISPVLDCLANSLHALFVPADGSKEGWTSSNAMDEVREQIRSDLIAWNARGKDKISCLLVTDDEYEKHPSVEWFVNPYGDE